MGISFHAYRERRFTHIAPRVTIDGVKYLADVIWGGLAVPLSLSNKHEPGFYLECNDGEWNVLESVDCKQIPQYQIYNRTLTDEDIKIFTDYGNASEEREVAHRLMFDLHS